MGIHIIEFRRIVILKLQGKKIPADLFVVVLDFLAKADHISM